MDAATYTYVRVKADSGDIWAASERFDVKVGDRVVIPLDSPMRNFHSQSLNRDFPIIYFATRITREGVSPSSAAKAGMAMASAHDSSTPAPSQVPDVIAQPAGGTSIKDVWAERKALSGKTLTVRGRVVKVNNEILDRNWLHLQDGTGTAADGTNDLTVTTAAVAQVGDVITVTGTLALDKDFTAGYVYPVILENATIVKQR
jgi:ribosomal protein S17